MGAIVGNNQHRASALERKAVGDVHVPGIGAGPCGLCSNDEVGAPRVVQHNRCDAAAAGFGFAPFCADTLGGGGRFEGSPHGRVLCTIDLAMLIENNGIGSPGHSDRDGCGGRRY